MSASSGLRALDYVGPVLCWSAALRGPAAPIPLAYLTLFTLSQWITFLKVTCADGHPMYLFLASPAGPAGIWVCVLSCCRHPLLGLLCLSPSGQGGPSSRAVGMCTPCSAMRWSIAALFGLYPRDGPHVPAPGSISVWRAAPLSGIDTRASQGVPHPKGMVMGTAPWTMGPLVPSGSWSWAQGARCGVCSPV